MGLYNVWLHIYFIQVLSLKKKNKRLKWIDYKWSAEFNMVIFKNCINFLNAKHRACFFLWVCWLFSSSNIKQHINDPCSQSKFPVAIHILSYYLDYVALSPGSCCGLPLRGWLWMLMACVWYWPSSPCTQMRWESPVSLKHAPMASTCSLDLFKAFIS